MDGLKVSTASATGNPRNKVSLKQGRSLMDWIRLTNSATDLTGVRGQLKDVSLQELALHNKRTDAWLAIRGLVYNVTEYFEFHPGGEDELMRGIGIDATEIFDQVHKWVNYDSMLKKCLVGRLKAETFLPPPKMQAKKSSASNGGSFRTPSVPKLVSEVTCDWMQTATSVTIIFYTRQKSLDRNRISIGRKDPRSVRVRIHFIDGQCYDHGVHLSHAVHAKCNVAVSPMTGKVELTFLKMNPPGSGSESQWKSLGVADSELRRTSKRSEAAVFFRTARLSARSRVTHNVELFSFTFASGDVFHVPMGWHVQMKHTLEDGSELKRSYTPVLLDLDHLSAEECPQVARDALTLHFLIKIYAEGPFSLQLDQLKENDEMEISEPIGSFDSKDCQLQTRDLVAIAAGTGITPMIRLIVNALQHGRKVSLLFCNRGSRDVIWNQKFLDLAETCLIYFMILLS